MTAAVRFTSFYAGVEEYDNPGLSGRPFVVTLPSRHGLSTVLDCSAAAVAYGVRPGQLLSEAQTLLPGIAQLSARLPRYSEFSRRLMDVLSQISPQLESAAVDAAYLDLTSCQSYYRHQPERIGKLIRHTLQSRLPLNYGIGISGDKTTAHYAAKLSISRDTGFCIIPPEAAGSTLFTEPLEAVFDLGPEVRQFLQEHAVHTCGDIKKLPAQIFQHRFGPLGAELWLMAQGKDPRAVQVASTDPIGVQVGKLLPPDTRDAPTVLFQLYTLSEKLALQLARRAEPASEFVFSLRCDHGWRQEHVQIPGATHDAGIIFQWGKKFLKRYWLGEAVFQLRIQARHAVPQPGQHDIFTRREPLRPVLQPG